MVDFVSEKQIWTLFSGHKQTPDHNTGSAVSNYTLRRFQGSIISATNQSSEDTG